MKIKMLKTHADPNGVHLAGKTYEVEDPLGVVLVEAGAAVQLSEPVSVSKPVEKANEIEYAL